MKRAALRFCQGMLLAILITSAYHARAFYDPTIGRWISRDPIEESGGVNLYCTVQNNPIQFSDKWGLFVSANPNDAWAVMCSFNCGGRPYSIINSCCCNGKVVSRSDTATGVHVWKWVSPVSNPNNPGGAPDMHVWLTWPGGSVDANAINSSGSSDSANAPMGGGYVSTPAAAIQLGFKGSATDVKLSPCSYDFGKLFACLTKKSAAYAAKGFFLSGNCQNFVDTILSECKKESKGCTAP